MKQQVEPKLPNEPGHHVASGRDDHHEDDSMKADGESNRNAISPEKLRMKDWLILAALSTSCFAIGSNFSALSPILPFEFTNKGINAMQSALILGAYEFVQFISYPFAGSLVPMMGVKSALSYSCLLIGLSVMAFAALVFCPAGLPFVVSALTLRSMAGFGSAVVLTANFAVLMTEYGDRIPTAISLVSRFLRIKYLL